jgi:hypothetical protein
LPSFPGPEAGARDIEQLNNMFWLNIRKVYNLFFNYDLYDKIDYLLLLFSNKGLY